MPSLDSILWILLGGLLLFVAMLVIAYFIVRFLFVRLAERMSAEIALKLDAAASQASTRIAARPGADAFLARLERTARLMDRAIKLPVIGGVGLDALLGLIPYVGDAISTVVAGSIILDSLQYGLPRSLVAKMVANMFVDALFGAVPVVGDLFDIGFKANTRNIAILKEYLDAQGRGTAASG